MFKVLLAIWVTAKRHIVMVALATVVLVCAIIFYPSINEFFLFPVGQTHFEFFDGRLQNSKLGTEKNINPIGARRPVDRSRENFFEFTTNDICKFFSSFIENVFLSLYKTSLWAAMIPKRIMASPTAHGIFSLKILFMEFH